MIIKTCIISFLFSFSTYAAIDELVDCSRSLEVYGKGKSLNLTENLHILPATRDKKNGYYVYTNKDSYFCALPGKKSQYLISLQIAGEQPQYLTYDTENGFSGQPEPESRDNGYAKAKCIAYKDDKSRAALEQEVKARLASTTKTAKETKKSEKEVVSKYYVNNDKQLREHELELSAQFPKVLKKCSKVDGEIGKLAEQEINKSSSKSETKNSNNSSTLSK